MCDQEFRTLRIDPRYPFTNQTKMNACRVILHLTISKDWLSQSNGVVFRACYDNYCDYYKCTRLLGEVDDCKIFKRYFETICPNFWIAHWDELRAKGAFPGPV